MDKKFIQDIDVSNKKVLVRVDYNVPMDDNGKITDVIRIRSSFETLKYLLKRNAAVIILAHLGRPKGKVNPKFSLKPVAEELAKLIKKPVKFAPDCVGPDAKKAAADLKSGEILLLENLRFHPEEEANDPKFSEELASLGNLYINDGFGVSHRAHASVEGITHYLPAAAGFLLEKEIKYLGNAVDKPVRPFAAIMGGSKVSDKINVIDSLIDKTDMLIIGGGMANTFLAAQGYNMGKSLVEQDSIEVAKKLLKKATSKKVKLLLPVDLVMAEAFDAKAKNEVEDIHKLNPEYMALDIGPKTCTLYEKALSGVKTVIWNGPMGVFEMPAFANGTEAIARTLADSSAITIVGGGDSAAAAKKFKLTNKFDHVSTGGGASLEYLEGKILPGVAALDDLRTPMIAANWKCHKTVETAVNLACDVVEATKGTYSEVVVFPPFTALESVADAIDGQQVGYGAQDLFYEDNGAFTGAVSGPMIAEIGCEYVLVGHSERRNIFGDEDPIVARKLQAAIRNDLKPILCVGESPKERSTGRTGVKLVRQLSSALSKVKEADVLQMVIAYEPLWAIGTGISAKPADVADAADLIREQLAILYNEKVAKRVRILYGGSVTAKNAHSFHIDGVDGLLVGGASLDAKSFTEIVRSF